MQMEIVLEAPRQNPRCHDPLPDRPRAPLVTGRRSNVPSAESRFGHRVLGIRRGEDLAPIAGRIDRHRASPSLQPSRNQVRSLGSDDPVLSCEIPWNRHPSQDRHHPPNLQSRMAFSGLSPPCERRAFQAIRSHPVRPGRESRLAACLSTIYLVDSINADSLSNLDFPD